MYSQIITPNSLVNSRKVQRKGANLNNSPECDKPSTHNMVIKSVGKQMAMQDGNYQKVTMKSDSMDIIFEYPTSQNDDVIIREVKAILLNMLHEQLGNIA